VDERKVIERLKAGVARVLSGEPREPLFSIPKPKEMVEAAAESEVITMPAPPKAAAGKD